MEPTNLQVGSSSCVVVEELSRDPSLRSFGEGAGSFKWELEGDLFRLNTCVCDRDSSGCQESEQRFQSLVH